MSLPRIVAVVACLFPQVIAAQDSAVRPAVIDVHWHASLSPGDLHGPEAVANRARAIQRLDSLNVTYIVVNGVPDAIAVWRDEFPGLVIPALLFPCREGRAPNYGRPCFDGEQEFPDTAWLRSEIRDGRIQALGEITAQYLGIAPNDDRLAPYYALAEELDIPVLIHLGLGPPAAAYPESPVPYKSPDFRAAAGSPLLLEEVLLRHKRLRVAIMHAGWPLIDETIYMLYQHPNVYVDIAVLQWAIPRPAYLSTIRRIVDAGYADRMMLGSDSGVGRLQQAIEALEAADFLTDQQRSDIMFNNAARFFKLTANNSSAGGLTRR
jgi:uncharacterized protein